MPYIPSAYQPDSSIRRKGLLRSSVSSGKEGERRGRSVYRGYIQPGTQGGRKGGREGGKVINLTSIIAKIQGLGPKHIFGHHGNRYMHNNISTYDQHFSRRHSSGTGSETSQHIML